LGTTAQESKDTYKNITTFIFFQGLFIFSCILFLMIYEINLEDFNNDKFIQHTANLYGGFWKDNKAVFLNKKEYNDFIDFLFNTFEIKTLQSKEYIDSEILGISKDLLYILNDLGLLKFQNNRDFEQLKVKLSIIMAELNTLSAKELQSFFKMSILLESNYFITAEMIKEKYNISQEQYNRLINVHYLNEELIGIQKNLSLNNGVNSLFPN
jgi:hypothetical protein